MAEESRLTYKDVAALMKIIHVSFAEVPDQKNPHLWLKRLPFYTGIVREMARTNTVISIHHLDFVGGIEVDDVRYQFFKPKWFQRIFPYRVYKFLKTERPDAVILHGLHFSWRNFLLRILFRREFAIFIQHHAEKPLPVLRGLFQRITDRFISGYFFTSKHIGMEWVQKNLISDHRKIHEVMEGSSFFRNPGKSEARIQTGVTGDPVYIWVGRLDKNKDPEILIKAFRKFRGTTPAAKLYIISKGGPLAALVHNLVSGQTGIKFAGEIPHDDMELWYSTADFVISTSHYEGSGLAVCEAMACGCIPILSDIPSFRMMTSVGETGLLFKTGDAHSLTDALNASTQMDIPDAAGRVGNQFRKRLSFEAIAEKIITVIRDARRAG